MDVPVIRKNILNTYIFFLSFLQLHSEEMSVYQCCEICFSESLLIGEFVFIIIRLLNSYQAINININIVVA